VTDAGLAVVASAFVRATTVSVPELASEASVEAYRVAVAALENPSPGVDLALLLQGYQNAFAAVVASHDEAVRSLEQAPLSPGATFIRGILIVNKTYSLPSSYGDGLTSETLAAFAAMQAEAAAAGHNLYISSGFRSFWSQQSIYNGLVSSVGQAAADRDTARPGHSEHQSGLTFDLNTIDEAFGTRPEGIWARDNAHRFGFVVRYPLGKEAITGYVWEPWHLRYLGVPVASELYSGGLTLEEYLGVTSVYAD
jgi:LAS superfamily LD-carboxypeptidase LdcB